LCSLIRPNPEKQVLVLGRHTRRSKNFEALNVASRKGLILFQLPGHMAPRLQPFDVSVLGPVKHYDERGVEKDDAQAKLWSKTVFRDHWEKTMQRQQRSETHCLYPEQRTAASRSTCLH
jgi:hypothetical protein